MTTTLSRMSAAQDPTTPFKRRVLSGAMIVIALIVVLYFLWQAVYVLLLIFAGILLAVLLRTLAEYLHAWTRLPIGWSLAVVCATLLGGLALLVWLGAPPLSKQFEELADDLPRAVESLKARVAQYKWGAWFVANAPTTQQVAERGQRILLRSPGALTTAFSAIVAVITIAFVAVYLAAEPELSTNGVLRLVPKQHREHGARVLASVRYTLQWWLIGQGITMIVIGVLIGAGLWLIGVPLWFLLGLLAALFNFIPNFGPFVSYIPSVLLALAIGPSAAIWVTVLFIVAQSFEGYLLTPLVQRKAVLLPPALTITTQVLLGILVGILGVMLAAPLTAAVLVVVKMLYVEEVLGDEMHTPDEKMPRSELPKVPR
jgi:predicted PurR-regulated permease PerM